MEFQFMGLGVGPYLKKQGFQDLPNKSTTLLSLQNKQTQYTFESNGFCLSKTGKQTPKVQPSVKQ